MALAAAAAFEGARAGWLVAVLVVDHGLQPESASVASQVAQRLRTLAPFEGLRSVDVVRVQVGSAGGPEAAARAARRAALIEAAEQRDALILLGHTRDDQAESVVLGLARGSGLRSIAAMRPIAGRFRRPLLDVSRADTVQACTALAIPVWHDPHNDDGRFTRVRVRRDVLPVLEAALGPGIAEALARTAEMARVDADALDALAEDLAATAGLAQVPERPDLTAEACVAVPALASAPEALRRRVLRLAALAAGCPGGELFAVHVRAVEDLVISWHGQAGVDLPGGVTARRCGDRLAFIPPPAAP